MGIACSATCSQKDSENQDSTGDSQHQYDVGTLHPLVESEHQPELLVLQPTLAMPDPALEPTSREPTSREPAAREPTAREPVAEATKADRSVRAADSVDMAKPEKPNPEAEDGKRRRPSLGDDASSVAPSEAPSGSEAPSESAVPSDALSEPSETTAVPHGAKKKKGYAAVHGDTKHDTKHKGHSKKEDVETKKKKKQPVAQKDKEKEKPTTDLSEAAWIAKHATAWKALSTEDRQHKVSEVVAAAKAEDHDLLQKLILGGTKVNATDPEGRNALRTAAKTGNTQIINTLLEMGSKINAANKYSSETALHYAFKYGKLETAIILVKAGAELEAKNKKGETPVQLCKNEEIVKWMAGNPRSTEPPSL